jgi:hypothetical protein
MEAPIPVMGSPLAIVVAEHASASLDWLDQASVGQLSSSAGQVACDVMVVSQQATEEPVDFAGRVTRRLSRVDAAGRSVARAVLACGPLSGDASLRGRVQTAQALLTSLRNAPGSSLILAAPSHADPRLRHELMAIAGALLEGAQSAGPEIRVHFGSPGPRRSRTTERRAETKQVA